MNGGGIRTAVALATLGLGSSQGGLPPRVDCSGSPNCTQRFREPCDVLGNVPNACGDCQPGAHGAFGPANTACLTNASCALIFPGQDACPGEDEPGPRAPMVVPFGRCVCDVDGLWWPTATGKCAKVEVTNPTGSGTYVVSQCSSTTCDPDSCLALAEWSPLEAFACKTRGIDSLLVSDGCDELLDALPGPPPFSALCGHPGLVANPPDAGVDVEHHRDCNLAPKCPESVLGDTRLEQTCCYGTPHSNPLTEWGRNPNEQAPGFCSVNPWEGRNWTGRVAYNHSEGVCLVRTSGPGWRGCACLDDLGLPNADRVCTVDCTLPDCPLPEGGIRPTPEEWLTSQVPAQLFPPDRSQWISTSSAPLGTSRLRTAWRLFSALAAASSAGVVNL